MTDTLSSFIASVALVAACGAAVDTIAVRDVPVMHTRAGVAGPPAGHRATAPATTVTASARADRGAPACCQADDANQD